MNKVSRWAKVKKFSTTRLIACVALGIVCAFSCGVAFADEESSNSSVSSDNQVNPGQLPDTSIDHQTAIEDLCSADATYDGKSVEIQGEVVGDRIYADFDGNFVWITVASLDDPNSSVMVYMSKAQSDLIDSYGEYNVKGTTLTIQGIFYLACDEHQGSTGIHATDVTVVALGSETQEEFDWHDFVPGVIAVGVGIVFMLLYVFLRERLR